MWTINIPEEKVLPIGITDNQILVSPKDYSRKRVSSYSYSPAGTSALSWEHYDPNFSFAFMTESKLFRGINRSDDTQLKLVDPNSGAELPLPEQLKTEPRKIKAVMLTYNKYYICEIKTPESITVTIPHHPKFMSEDLIHAASNCAAYSDNDELLWQTGLPKGENNYALNWDDGSIIEGNSPEFDATITKWVDEKISFTISNPKPQHVPVTAISQFSEVIFAGEYSDSDELFDLEKIIGKKLKNVSFSKNGANLKHIDGNNVSLTMDEVDFGHIRFLARKDAGNSLVSAWYQTHAEYSLPFLNSFSFGPETPEFLKTPRRLEEYNLMPSNLMMNSKLILQVEWKETTTQITAYAPKE